MRCVIELFIEFGGDEGPDDLLEAVRTCKYTGQSLEDVRGEGGWTGEETGQHGQ